MIDYRKAFEEVEAQTGNLKLEFDKPDNIIFAGMGGSGISGDLVKDIVSESLSIPLEISKSYNLPAYASSKSLFICTSYSGNTEETLTQFVEAVKRKCSIISITSGGKLLEWSEKLGIPVIKLPTGFQPRDALPFLFFSLALSLEKLGLKEFSNDTKEFLELLPKIDLSQIDRIAQSLKNSIAVIYGPSEFSGVLRRIKSELNENSKVFAKFEELPELNHNEVVGYEVSSYANVSVIFLRDKKETPEIAKRIEITRDIVGDKVKGNYDIWAYGDSKLSRVLSLVFQGDYLSFKLAQIRGVNREQIKTIDKVKQDLKSLNTVGKLEKDLENHLN